MSDAPERIWMDGDIEVGEMYWSRCFEHPKQCSEPALEYIRADLHEAEITRLKAERDALRAAAEKMAESLRWYISEDETNEGEDMAPSGRGTWNEVNAYWIVRKRRASAALTAWEASQK